MPPAEPITSDVAEESPLPPRRAGAAVGKYLVIAVVVATVGTAVWVVVDALPHAFDVDPGRAARRGPPGVSAAPAPADSAATK